MGNLRGGQTLAALARSVRLGELDPYGAAEALLTAVETGPSSPA
jgi:hypothetical protein